MKRNPVTLVASLVLMTAASAAHAQIQTSVSVEFFPKKDRYARGETLTAVVTFKFLTSQGWVPLANTPTEVGDIWGEANWTTTLHPNTNAAGQVSFSYRIPTNPNWDNIYIYGVPRVGAPFTANFGKLRIPIGR